MRWWKRVLPVVAVISLIFNLYFLVGSWQAATHTNHYLWGNMTNYLIAGVTWAENGMEPEAEVALAVLDLMRSLPRYDRRVAPDDLRTIEQFLRQAPQVRARGSADEMAEVDEGFALLLDRLHRVNELKQDRYAFNDGAWRSMWGEIAQGLERLDLP